MNLRESKKLLIRKESYVYMKHSHTKWKQAVTYRTK